MHEPPSTSTRHRRRASAEGRSSAVSSFGGSLSPLITSCGPTAGRAYQICRQPSFILYLFLILLVRLLAGALNPSRQPAQSPPGRGEPTTGR